MNILIKDATILTMPEIGQKEVATLYGDIAIHNGRISGVGVVGREGSFDRVIDAADCVVLPGFVNTHTHAAMSLFRGYADDLPLMEWLNTKIWPIEEKLTAEDVYWGTMLSILEMIKSGTTTFADMYFFMEDVARAVEQTGIRAVLSRGMIGLGPNADLAIAESTSLVKNWQGKGSGRITTMLGPHAPFTCPPDYLKKVITLSEKLGVGIHIHLAETLREVADVEKAYGQRPVDLMDSLGLFDRPVLGAHLVHVTEREIAILLDKKVGVAHNPQSNMKLASGIAPVAQMLAKGIPVAIGTDGASSNNNLDMIEEMRTASFLAKLSTMDPTALPAGRVLAMGTSHGAQALGLADEIGQIAVGKKADLTIVDFHSPHLCPRHDEKAHLVYAAQPSDVKTVIIDGRIIMENRRMLTMDEEEIMFQANRCAARLAGK